MGFEREEGGLERQNRYEAGKESEPFEEELGLGLDLMEKALIDLERIDRQVTKKKSDRKKRVCEGLFEASTKTSAWPLLLMTAALELADPKTKIDARERGVSVEWFDKQVQAQAGYGLAEINEWFGRDKITLLRSYSQDLERRDGMLFSRPSVLIETRQRLRDGGEMGKVMGLLERTAARFLDEPMVITRRFSMSLESEPPQREEVTRVVESMGDPDRSEDAQAIVRGWLNMPSMELWMEMGSEIEARRKAKKLPILNAEWLALMKNFNPLALSIDSNPRARETCLSIMEAGLLEVKSKEWKLLVEKVQERSLYLFEALSAAAVELIDNQNPGALGESPLYNRPRAGPLVLGESRKNLALEQLALLWAEQSGAGRSEIMAAPDVLRVVEALGSNAEAERALTSRVGWEELGKIFHASGDRPGEDQRIRRARSVKLAGLWLKAEKVRVVHNGLDEIIEGMEAQTQQWLNSPSVKPLLLVSRPVGNGLMNWWITFTVVRLANEIAAEGKSARLLPIPGGGLVLGGIPTAPDEQVIVPVQDMNRFTHRLARVFQESSAWSRVPIRVKDPEFATLGSVFVPEHDPEPVRQLREQKLKRLKEGSLVALSRRGDRVRLDNNGTDRELAEAGITALTFTQRPDCVRVEVGWWGHTVLFELDHTGELTEDLQESWEEIPGFEWLHTLALLYIDRIKNERVVTAIATGKEEQRRGQADQDFRGRRAHLKLLPDAYRNRQMNERDFLEALRETMIEEDLDGKVLELYQSWQRAEADEVGNGEESSGGAGREERLSTLEDECEATFGFTIQEYNWYFVVSQVLGNYGWIANLPMRLKIAHLIERLKAEGSEEIRMLSFVPGIEGDEPLELWLPGLSQELVKRSEERRNTG